MSVMTDQTETTRSASRRIKRAALAVFALLVAFHCVAVLGFVVRHGRLAVVPLYDDASYLSDGYQRLSAFDQHGLPGLGATLLRDPPHAPYESAVAALGYAITPGSALGAYVLNAGWVLVFLALGWRMLTGIPPLMRLGLLAAGLSIPMLATVIGSFRPDIYWGLTTGAVAVILATQGVAGLTRTGVVLTGLLVGAAALCKPTGMMPSAAVMAVGYLGGLAIDLRLKRMRWREAGLRTVIFLLGVAAVVAPYLAVAWRDLLTYISNVLGKDADIWRTTGGLTTHLVYYLRPGLSLEWLGWLLYAAPVLIAVPLVLARGATRRPDIARAGLVVLVVLVSYAIPTASPVKIGFFGSIFYGTVIAASLWGAGWIARAVRFPSVAVFLVGVAVFALAWRPGNEFMQLTAPVYVATDQATRAVAPAIMDAIAADQDGAAPPIVYTSSPGPVYDGTLQYYAVLRGLKGRFIGAYTDADWQHVQSDVAASDIVIVSENGAAGQDHGFPFPMLPHQADLMAMLSADPAWHVIASYTDAADFKTVAFSRISPTAGAKVSFRSGFRDEEAGPGPGLLRFRWMTADTATVRLRAAGDDPHSVATLRCEAPAPIDVSITAPSGAVIAERRLQAAGVGPAGLHSIAIPFDGPALDATIRTIGTVAPGWPGPMLCSTVPQS